jgi:hypothetical protein
VIVLLKTFKPFNNQSNHSIFNLYQPAIKNRLVQVINALDKDTLKSITLFNGIKSAI